MDQVHSAQGNSHTRLLGNDYALASVARVLAITNGTHPGMVDLKALITNMFAFEDVDKAWEAAKNGKGTKTLIRGAGF
ncbi:unnamed protein product [Penicillium olsonii]|nr:unnamed protein product [Penicillium olsonii]